MRLEDVSEFLNRPLLVSTKSGMHYTGEIIKIADEHLIFLDKYGSKVMILLDDISILEEKRGTQ